MANLHPQLVEAVSRRLVIARAARIGWDSAVRIQLNHDLADASLAAAIMAYLDDNDPDEAIRRYEADLRTLERHWPVAVRTNIDPQMAACAYEWGDGDGYVEPYEFCPHVKNLLAVYIEVTR